MFKLQDKNQTVLVDDSNVLALGGGIDDVSWLVVSHGVGGVFFLVIALGHSLFRLLATT